MHEGVLCAGFVVMLTFLESWLVLRHLASLSGSFLLNSLSLTGIVFTTCREEQRALLLYFYTYKIVLPHFIWNFSVQEIKFERE